MDSDLAKLVDKYRMGNGASEEHNLFDLFWIRNDPVVTKVTGVAEIQGLSGGAGGVDQYRVGGLFPKSVTPQ